MGESFRMEDQAVRGAVSMRVFVSPFIERVLARAHPITPILWFGPIVAWAFYDALVRRSAGVLVTAGLFFAGWLCWTAIEYSLHRWVFHHEPDDTPAGRLGAFLMHGYHHAYPNDRYRLVAPPMMSWPLGAIFALACRLVVGPTGWLSVFAGIATGYVAYDWIHYYTHHFRPTTRLGKWIRAYHLRHHHDHSPTRFGVSSPLWDLILGTYASTPAREPAKAPVS